MMVADVVWAHLALQGEVEAGNIQDVPYMLQYVLFALAVNDERMRLRRHGADDVDYSARAVGGLPYISVALGYGLMLVVAWQSSSRGLFPLVVGGLSLTVLALARQVVAIRENVRLQRERTLLAGELRFKSLVQHSPDVITIVDADWTIRYVNPAALNTFGYPGAHMVGACVLDFVHPEDSGDAAARLREVLQDPRRTNTARWRVRQSDGNYIETDNICANLLADEYVRGIVLTTRDITALCNLEAQLVHQAFTDSLTGLANRALFEDRVQHALSRRRGDMSTLGVLYLDLDEFKAVNDSLGHAAGDALLKAAAERLLSFLRAFDTAARLGGDEFAVLIDDIRQTEHVTSVASRIAQAFCEPFVIDGREVMATASVGVALATPNQTAEELLRNADLAMYLAKQRGRAQTAVYEPSMQVAVLDRMDLQQDLKVALERGELSVVYQPIHSLDTQALVGAEALLRWTHPTRGPIPPSAFVPIAEETGLIVPIGRWVLQRACEDARQWRLRMPATTPLRVSVNLSGRQLPEPTLLDDVTRALRDSGLPAKLLVLELTESMLLQHHEQALAVMRQLKAHGIRLAIDDFGTGYSSLSYLQRLPIDILKVDRAFVERIEDDPGAEALTRTIVALGRTMSLRTIAEGIESRRQAEQLRTIGCDFGQGFFYGTPMPAAELELYATRWNALTVA
jgi:diguanylate cyclase (GGDEF)-like protein/PAS domain S-box-containing protein